MVITLKDNSATLKKRIPQRGGLIVSIDYDTIVEAMIIFVSFLGVGQ